MTMNKTLASLALLIGLGFSTASAKPYISGTIGLGMPGGMEIEEVEDAVEYDTGLALAAAVGYDFGDVRLEGELSYLSSDVDSILDVPTELWGFDDYKTSLTSLMANGYYDIDLNTAGISPYLMGGIGLTIADFKFEYDNTTYESDETYFAFQLGTGVGIAVSDKLDLDLGYRYFRPTGTEFEEYNWEASISVHKFMAGLRYTL